MIAPPKAPPPNNTIMKPTKDAIGELRRQRTHELSPIKQINQSKSLYLIYIYEQE